MKECCRIRDESDLDGLRAEACKEKHDERLALAEVARFCLDQSILRFPMDGQIEPDPPAPDVILSDSNVKIGIRVRRAVTEIPQEKLKEGLIGNEDKKYFFHSISKIISKRIINSSEYLFIIDDTITIDEKLFFLTCDNKKSHK